MRPLLRFAAALALAGGAAAAAKGADGPPRLVYLSWDGGADWVIDRLLEEGRLPQLARLAARGAAADYSVSTFPSKTAVAHATLWTGCWPPCHGVTGNDVPKLPLGSATALEMDDGFDSRVLAAEPIWITAARAGRRVVVLSATQSDPPEPHREALRRAGVPADGFRSFDGFGHVIAPGRVIGAEELRPARAAAWRPVPPHRGGLRELELAAGDAPLHGLVFDDPGDPAAGFDTLLVRAGSRRGGAGRPEARLKPRAATEPGAPPAGWSPPFAVRRGDASANTFFRIFELAPDGGRLVLYQRQASALAGIFTPADLAAYLEAYPGFHDEPYAPYLDGDLGPPLMAGGDGTAERRLLEMVAFDTALLRRGTRWVLETWRPDVLIHYTPMSDHAGHGWVGILDPASPLHDAALAARLWPYYAAVFAELDGWLGEIVDAAGEETIVALASDHGFAGIGRRLHVNQALEEAGLLARGADGAIDLGRTRVLSPPWGDFLLVVNDARWRGGIVPAAERDRVLDRAAAVLLGAHEPSWPGPIVERVFRPSELPGLGIGGERGGDLYFDPAAGLYPEADEIGPLLAAPAHPWGSGEHGFWPERRSMHAIFYLAGPGVAAGVRLPAVRHADLAPTLARLIGIPAPPQATGRVIAEALAGERP